MSLLRNLILLVVVCLAPLAHAGDSVSLRVIAINDFHGNLQPPKGRNDDGDMGGAAWLAAHARAARTGQAHSVFVSAGDLINASPFQSALFQDEPTIEVMNAMDLALNAVGNHEFDEGVDELRRMQDGGCHPKLGCQFRPMFEGARFRFLAANVMNAGEANTLFPAYEIREYDGVKVAFVGLTLQNTRSMVNARGIVGWKFRDEADTVNALVPQLRAKGANAIVLLIHEGGYASGGPDTCPALSGPLVGVLKQLDAAVGVVISGHTHQAYNCEIDGRRVTSAGFYGRYYTKLDLTLDKRTGTLTAVDAHNIAVTHDIAPDAKVAAIVDEAARLARAKDRIAGKLQASIERTGMDGRDMLNGASGESALGNVVADAQVWATRTAGAQIAFMNSGGLRAELIRRNDGTVMYSDLFATQPFSNNLVTVTLSGAQILELLEQQFPGKSNGQTYPRVLQVSKGFAYTWSASAPAGHRVTEVKLDGKPLDPKANYRVTVNDYLLTGGDRFAVLREGTDSEAGPIDVAALEAYFAAHSPVAPPALGRIKRLP